MSRDKTVTALAGVGIIALMLGVTAAAVPLYDLFCRTTGYGGTTAIGAAAPGEVSGRTIEVRFNADVDRRLPWTFQPVQRRIQVPIGASTLAFYRARNDGNVPLVGTATFNVTPFAAGPHFAKIACFCFEEQRLEPGESVEMPVSFFVDPAILDDPAAADVSSITLSYTFFAAGPAKGQPKLGSVTTADEATGG